MGVCSFKVQQFPFGSIVHSLTDSKADAAHSLCVCSSVYCRFFTALSFSSLPIGSFCLSSISQQWTFASLWHINSTISFAELDGVTLHLLYIQCSHTKVSEGSLLADTLPAHPFKKKKSRPMELLENKESNLIQRRRCLYAHVTNAFIAVWRPPLRLQSWALIPWPDILQISLSPRSSLALH